MDVGGRPSDGEGSRPQLRRELAIWFAVLVFYAALTSIDWSGRERLAVDNSRWLFELERSLHIDIELALNQWLVPRGALRVVANYEYAITYIVSSLVLLVWLYRRRPSTYRWARRSFILMNVVSLICFVVYPVAPPRMLADLGYIDTVVFDRTWGSWGSPLVEHANQLAAMPSLHIGWALWVSLILATIASGWLTQAASGLHVLVTLLVIMATANHYLIDAAGGVLVAVAAVALTRPHADGSSRWDAATDALQRKVAPPAIAPQVGGVVLLNPEHPTGRTVPDGQVRQAVEAVVRTHVNDEPRLHQRHSQPSRWQRPRWVDHPDLDWSWHVSEGALPSLDGEAPLHALMVQVANTPLPADRPPWRLLVVPGRRGRRSAVIMVAHYAVADGLDAIAESLTSPKPPRPHGREPRLVSNVDDRR
jgi:diacylglycerol O-acyltransferase / wax synthase